VARPALTRRICDSPYGQIHYWVTGTGPHLTLFHQSAQSSVEYERIAPLLADAFTVVGLDLPGHGRSDDPPHEMEMDDLTASALAVLDDAGVERTHVLGHHGGVSLTLDLATKHPARVDKVIHSGGGTRTEEEFEALKNMPMTRDLPLDEAGDFLAQTWSVYRRMSAQKTPPNITLLPLVAGLQARLRPFDMHHALYRWDAEAARAKFDKETLLIKGTEDLFGGNVADRHAHMPGSTYVEIPDGGAWLFYEQPEACAKAVRAFLLAD
jgi:pimeloyl-ACP methyl ester carboxylesterase